MIFELKDSFWGLVTRIGFLWKSSGNMWLLLCWKVQFLNLPLVQWILALLQALETALYIPQSTLVLNGGLAFPTPTPCYESARLRQVNGISRSLWFHKDRGEKAPCCYSSTPATNLLLTKGTMSVKVLYLHKRMIFFAVILFWWMHDFIFPCLQCSDKQSN